MNTREDHKAKDYKFCKFKIRQSGISTVCIEVSNKNYSLNYRQVDKRSANLPSAVCRIKGKSIEPL